MLLQCALLPKDREAFVSLAEFLGYLIRAIGSSIYDNDDLNVAIGLSRNTLQALLQILRYVVGG